jgi:hypothetical protein
MIFRDFNFTFHRLRNRIDVVVFVRVRALLRGGVPEGIRKPAQAVVVLRFFTGFLRVRSCGYARGLEAIPSTILVRLCAGSAVLLFAALVSSTEDLFVVVRNSRSLRSRGLPAPALYER